MIMKMKYYISEHVMLKLHTSTQEITYSVKLYYFWLVSLYFRWMIIDITMLVHKARWE